MSNAIICNHERKLLREVDKKVKHLKNCFDSIKKSSSLFCLKEGVLNFCQHEGYDHNPHSTSWKSLHELLSFNDLRIKYASSCNCCFSPKENGLIFTRPKRFQFSYNFFVDKFIENSSSKHFVSVIVTQNGRRDVPSRQIVTTQRISQGNNNISCIVDASKKLSGTKDYILIRHFKLGNSKPSKCVIETMTISLAEI